MSCLGLYCINHIVCIVVFMFYVHHPQQVMESIMSLSTMWHGKENQVDKEVHLLMNVE